MTAAKKIIILAGPNGAGKTTFAREFLPNEAACPVFINADLIAAGLSPFQPETAAGGHHIDPWVIQRRFDAGVANFLHLYRSLVDRWYLYDNTGKAPLLMSSGENT